LFGGDSRTGDAAEFVVSRDGLLIVAAAGAAMEAGAQDTVTPIRVHIFRSRLRAPNETPLPDPLADPAQDIRVHRATAKAYFVRAGEYIQIIDVDGRQCTDFQCFAARKLDKGLEHPLDVTATRSLVGQNYPLPGLFSKVFDQDTQPLVEVVRDGRAARCLQFRLSRALLRRPGLSRPRQLHGQLWADCERFQESRSLYEW
jgi:aminomethyltransferase